LDHGPGPGIHRRPRKFHEGLAESLIAFAEAVYANRRDLPDFPEPLGPVWQAFVDLAGTRQVGMAANPITFSEIEAFKRQTLTPLSAWEVRLLRRLDQAVLPILNPAPASNTVNVRDGKGVLSMIRGQAAKHNPPKAKESA
jgi:hypothetical protein